MAIDGDEVCACHGKLEAYEQMAEALREMDANCENRQDEPFVKYVRQTCRAALRAAGGE